MAHGRRRSPDNALPNADASQDPLLLAGPPVTFDPLPAIDPYSQDPIQTLTEIQDARQWSPESVSDSSSLVGTVAPTTYIHPSGALPSNVGYNRPAEAIHCVRRQQRREVFFAKRLYRKKGKGGSRKRNFWSQFKC